jgi:hypothetical protein
MNGCYDCGQLTSGDCGKHGPKTFSIAPYMAAAIMTVNKEEAERQHARSEQLRFLAKQAVNGWACYARTKHEHAEIARLHAAIDALADGNQPSEAKRAATPSASAAQEKAMPHSSKRTP